MATWNFNKELYNALVGQSLVTSHLHNRLLSGSNARHFSNIVCRRSPEDKRSTQEFRRKENKLYQQYRWTFAWNCCLIANHAQRLPTKLDKCRYFGSGKFEFGQRKFREKSGNFTFYNLWEPCWNHEDRFSQDKASFFEDNARFS